MQLSENDMELLKNKPQDFFLLLNKKRELILDNIDLMQRYRSAAMSTSANVGDGSGVFGGGSSSKVEANITKALEIDALISGQVDDYNTYKDKVIFVINTYIDKPHNRQMMYQHYVKNRKWKTVARDLKITARGLYKRQEKIFKEISEKACTFT